MPQSDLFSPLRKKLSPVYSQSFSCLSQNRPLPSKRKLWIYLECIVKASTFALAFKDSGSTNESSWDLPCVIEGLMAFVDQKKDFKKSCKYFADKKKGITFAVRFPLWDSVWKQTFDLWINYKQVVQERDWQVWTWSISTVQFSNKFKEMIVLSRENKK